MPLRPMLASLTSLMLCTACVTPEVLEPLPADMPPGVDFAGQWELAGDRAELDRRINDAIRRTDDVRDDRVLAAPAPDPRRGGRRSSGRVKGGIVYVFFESGSNLKISQTPDGLFVSFDRAVVEEYRYGERREIRMGQATASRVSGWDGDDYVIETLDRNRMKLTERYQLSDSGDTLTRRITFRSRDGETATVIERFRRG